MQPSQNLVRQVFADKVYKRAIEEEYALAQQSAVLPGKPHPTGNTLILTGPAFIEHYNAHIKNVGPRNKFVVAEIDMMVYLDILAQSLTVKDKRVIVRHDDVFNILFSDVVNVWTRVDLDLCKTFDVTEREHKIISQLQRLLETGKLSSNGAFLTLTFCQRNDGDGEGYAFLKHIFPALCVSAGYTILDDRVRRYKDHGPPMITSFYHLRKYYR
jgi:hypothetical protein